MRAFEAFQQRLMAVHVTEFTTLDLTMAQAKLLYVVMAAGPLSLGEIASRLRITASTASGAVDHLVGLGLLSRADDPTDRRQLRVSVTGHGRKTIAQMRELSQRQLRALFEVISDADLDVVARRHADHGRRGLGLDEQSDASDDDDSPRPTRRPQGAPE